MEGRPDSESPPKKRKTRPSRSRGLRTNTGCLTCRKRKLKCDEVKPTCGQCLKSSRSCGYSEPSEASFLDHDPAFVLPRRPPEQPPSDSFADNLRPVRQSTDETQQYQHYRTFSNESHHSSHQTNLQDQSGHVGSEFGFSPVAQTSKLTPGTGSLDWYDLIARDAASNVDNYNFLTSSGSRWSFEPAETFRTTRQQNSQSSYKSPTASETVLQETSSQTVLNPITNFVRPADEPWSTTRPVNLKETDLHYFQYFVEVIGPMMDLFDPKKHFTNYVPHLALYNTGLWKSMLAVAARHKGLRSADISTPQADKTTSPKVTSTHDTRDEDRGTQYYYETLHYLSSAMKYSSYAKSSEIIATSILISTYEAFGSDASEDWERHLKGVFWIQRSQDNDGEREGLRQAVWWNWLRQDIWAALRSKRKTLTIWRPKKTLRDLTPEEIASRVLFLQAKAVKYASEEAIQSQDLAQRIEEGDVLLGLLREWYEYLPIEFKPIPITQNMQAGKPFPEMFIHPPIYAAAMQAYASAKILVLLNKPSLGGLLAWQEVQKMLDQSVGIICGLVQGPGASTMPSAMVNFQALFVAGQCVRDKGQQEFVSNYLKQMIKSCLFPAKDLINELRHVWAGSE